MELIKTILSNHRSSIPGKGMPLGNLTSQFFANIYLGELDNFVKHQLKAKYYLRYVDDFVILGRDRKELEQYKKQIAKFLVETLKIDLHPQKSRVIQLSDGVTLLGFRVFFHHKLLKKSNLNRIFKRLSKFQERLEEGIIIEEHIKNSIAGWEGYAKMANTYNLRQKIRERINAILDAMPQRIRFGSLEQSTITSFF